MKNLIERLRLPEPVYVTRPVMPALETFVGHLKGIWQRHYLTNHGPVHAELERRLREYLAAEHVSLFSNGTAALMVGLRALGLEEGEVITTPFTFPATPHAASWSGLTPSFCDIDPDTFTMDPGRIESLIGPDTKAILAVHVFGLPCDVGAIQEIADKHGLRVIYDAAHAFGVKYHGRHLAEYGDMAMLSFHATKVFTTLEGGALVVSSPEQKEKVDLLGNFGIVDAENISAPGINAKMNELEAAFGLAQLDSVEEEITKRGAVYRTYREMLADMPGLRVRPDTPNVRHNYCSCPMLVRAAVFGMTRDEVCRKLEEFNVIARKYYHPLCSDYPHYAHLPSSDPHRLPCAHDVAREILCLPCYGELDLAIVERICIILRELYQLAARK